MGTEKRERQKANRQLRLQEIAKQQQKQKTKRRALRIGLLVAGVVALTGIFYLTSRGGDNEDQAADASSTTVIDTAVVDTAPVTPQPFAYGTGECAKADGSSERSQTFSAAPQLCIDPAKTYTVTVETNKGTYAARLDQAIAPGTVNNFVNLARFHYFDDTVCHRAIPGFMVQCGDPTATGTGGPGYSIGDELPADGAYRVGSLAMANSGPDTNGSQFFVVTGDQGVSLPPSYSLFGEVTEGLDTTVKALDAAGNPESNGVPPLEEIKIVKVTVAES